MPPKLDSENRADSALIQSALPMQRSAAPGVWFVWLWVAWAALLGSALLVGNLTGSHGSSFALWTRMGSSIELAFTAWFAASLWRNLTAGRFALYLAVGMTLGAIGDFFNAGLLKFIPLPDPILGGIAAFGLGHMAYIAGCVVLSKQTGLTDRRAFVVAVMAWQLFGLVTWYFVACCGTEARGLVWPSLPYSALLSGTAGVTSGLALQDRRFLRLALGGASFLASDLLLAFGMFRGHFSHQTEWVWLTYGAGQMLIVFAVVDAYNVLNRKISV